jgi:hypothetical protein
VANGLCGAGGQSVIRPLFALDGYWIQVQDGDPRVARLYMRHYSCYRYRDNRRSQYGYRNRFLVMGPGEKLVLLSTDGRAIFGWRKFRDDSGQHGVNCSFFRNESPVLSSTLILDAERHARRRWPRERFYTFVNPTAIRSTNPGCCFQKAGWRRCGLTRRGLLIFEKLPSIARGK